MQVTFDTDTLKVKAASPISVIKNKKEYFQLNLNRTHTLVACTRFFIFFCSIGRVSKVAHSKIGIENPDLGTYAPHLSKYESWALLWKHTLILNQNRECSKCLLIRIKVSPWVAWIRYVEKGSVRVLVNVIFLIYSTLPERL